MVDSTFAGGWIGRLILVPDPSHPVLQVFQIMILDDFEALGGPEDPGMAPTTLKDLSASPAAWQAAKMPYSELGPPLPNPGWWQNQGVS